MTESLQILRTRVDELDLVEIIAQQFKVEKYIFEYVGLFYDIKDCVIILERPWASYSVHSKIILSSFFAGISLFQNSVLGNIMMQTYLATNF